MEVGSKNASACVLLHAENQLIHNLKKVDANMWRLVKNISLSEYDLEFFEIRGFQPYSPT